MPKPKVPLQQRFTANAKRGRGCWIWQGTKDSRGYGVLTIYERGIGKKLIKAHRLAWILFNGDIPKGTGHHGTYVLHKCDNPSCVNPAHLFLGTARDNADDRDRKMRQSHGIGTNTAKLTDAKVRHIRAIKSFKYGEVTALADKYGVCIDAIRRVRTRRTWRHL